MARQAPPHFWRSQVDASLSDPWHHARGQMIGSAQAGALLNEGFDNVADLASKGWVLNNASTVGGTATVKALDVPVYLGPARANVPLPVCFDGSREHEGSAPRPTPGSTHDSHA